MTNRIVMYAFVAAVVFALANAAMIETGASPSNPNGLRFRMELKLAPALGFMVSLLVALIAMVRGWFPKSL